MRREFVRSGSHRCTLKGETLIAKQEDSQGQDQRDTVRPRTQSTNQRKEGKHRLRPEEARRDPGGGCMEARGTTLGPLSDRLQGMGSGGRVKSLQSCADSQGQTPSREVW